MAVQAQRALHGGSLAQTLDHKYDGAVRQAVMELVGDFESMVGDLTERLGGLHGVIRSLQKA